MATHPVHIGEVLVNGIYFDPKNGERLRTMDLNSLLESVPRLFDLLEERQIDYVLVGGIAMLAYVEGRNTQDIDLIISSEALAKLPEIEIEDENRDFARGRLGAVSIDFLFANNALFDQVRRNHTTQNQFVERDVTCATVEGLMLLKLFALPALYRQGCFDRVRIYENDVAHLMERYGTDPQLALGQLAQHMLPSDVEELSRIVAEIEERLSKSRHRFGEKKVRFQVSQ